MTVRMEWHGPRVSEQERAAAARGVAAAAEHLLGASRRRVPIEEGTLERSGVASTDGERAAVSYDTPYAARQHEELTWQHDAGRTAKYLEGPLDEESDAMLEIVAAHVRRALRP